MNYTQTIKKLQRAINMHDHKLLYCTSEFYSTQMQRPIIMYYIKYAFFEGGKPNNKVLFKSASQLRLVFFLRDIFQMISEQRDLSIEEMAERAVAMQKSYNTKHDLMGGQDG